MLGHETRTGLVDWWGCAVEAFVGKNAELESDATKFHNPVPDPTEISTGTRYRQWIFYCQYNSIAA